MNTHHDVDDQVLAMHDRNARIVAESVFGLVERFAPQGMTPIAVFEGAIRGAALAIMLGNGDDPADVADALEEMASTFRAIDVNALKPTAN